MLFTFPHIARRHMTGEAGEQETLVQPQCRYALYCRDVIVGWSEGRGCKWAEDKRGSLSWRLMTTLGTISINFCWKYAFWGMCQVMFVTTVGKISRDENIEADRDAIYPKLPVGHAWFFTNRFSSSQTRPFEVSPRVTSSTRHREKSRSIKHSSTFGWQLWARKVPKLDPTQSEETPRWNRTQKLGPR